MPRVLHDIQTLHEARLRYMYATATLIDWNPSSQSEHLAILDAIKKCDATGACVLLEQHIATAGEILQAALANRVPSTG
jgi:DNA-binding GntR family transcriptional regulator